MQKGQATIFIVLLLALIILAALAFSGGIPQPSPNSLPFSQESLPPVSSASAN